MPFLILICLPSGQALGYLLGYDAEHPGNFGVVRDHAEAQRFSRREADKVCRALRRKRWDKIPSVVPVPAG